MAEKFDENIVSNFAVSIYGKLEKYNDVISKARVRIFYTKHNRNNTYISEEFAEKVLKTLSYSPVVGIYDEEEQDFTDHGKDRELGRAYGVVPENPNIQYEMHMDDDGVEREYACADIFLWTTRYSHANEIIGKKQSLELHKPSIKGEWKYIDNKKVFFYEDACFIGLMALGDDKEPCFEGGAFYTLAVSIQDMAEEIRNFTKANFKKENEPQRGVEKMDKLMNFKLSDSSKYDMLFSLINANYNADGNWSYEYSLCQVYDDYVLAYGYEDGAYYRINYTKDDSTDSVSLGDKVQTYVMDVTQEEMTALTMLKAMNNNNFEKIDTAFTDKDEKITSLETAASTFETEKATFETEKSTLETEKATIQSTFETEKADFEIQITNLRTENENLSSYKLAKDTAEKETIIAKYTSLLDDDVIAKYTKDLDTYECLALEKELSFELTQASPAIFTKNASDFRIPKLSDPVLTGAAKILSERNKMKNGGDK